MWGIFGVIPAQSNIDRGGFKNLRSAARQRGRDSPGRLLKSKENINLEVYRADNDMTRLGSQMVQYDAEFVCGHSRRITSEETDSQPVVSGAVCIVHNGTILNTVTIWSDLNSQPSSTLDSEVIDALMQNF